jgi:hypothetical protein
MAGENGGAVGLDEGDMANRDGGQPELLVHRFEPRRFRDLLVQAAAAWMCTVPTTWKSERSST